MPRWSCPHCDREFGRANQGHLCVPGVTVDQLFEHRDPLLRSIYGEIIEHVRSLGPVHEDVVSVGVFLKVDRKLAEIRQRRACLHLGLYLPTVISDPRIDRVLNSGAARVVHLLRVRSRADVDDQLRNWLTVAYLHARDS